MIKSDFKDLRKEIDCVIEGKINLIRREAKEALQ